MATGKKRDAVAVFREKFPNAFIGMRYGDLIRRYAADVDLWEQVLEDEKYRCRIEKKRPNPIPWLLEHYKRMEASIREIETPPDRLTTHRQNDLLRVPCCECHGRRSIRMMTAQGYVDVQCRRCEGTGDEPAKSIADLFDDTYQRGQA